MKFDISKNLNELYKSKHRNMDYSLDLIINSMDPETCKTAIEMVSELNLGEEKTSIDINSDSVSAIKELVSKETINEKVVELLLWVAILYPEI